MNIKYLIALALAGLLAMSSIAYAGESLNAYFTVNYITYLNPNGQVNNYYIEYTLSIYNNEPRSIPLNVSMSILPYSSVIYTSPAATAINNNMVTWIITLRPYSEEVLDVRFKPVYTLLPIATWTTGGYLLMDQA